jgi:PAS domain-containing protein
MYSSNAADIQRRFDQLLESLPAGVVVHCPDGRILSANRLARELLGRSENQLIGSEADASTWSFVWPDRTTMPPAEYPVNVVLRTRAMVKDLIVGVPADLPEPVRWLICNAYPEFGTDGRVRQVVVCFTDCTALKRAKQNLEKSEERLRLVLQGSTDASTNWSISTS